MPFLIPEFVMIGLTHVVLWRVIYFIWFFPWGCVNTWGPFHFGSQADRRAWKNIEGNSPPGIVDFFNPSPKTRVFNGKNVVHKLVDLDFPTYHSESSNCFFWMKMNEPFPPGVFRCFSGRLHQSTTPPPPRWFRGTLILRFVPFRRELPFEESRTSEVESVRLCSPFGRWWWRWRDVLPIIFDILTKCWDTVPLKYHEKIYFKTIYWLPYIIWNSHS